MDIPIWFNVEKASQAAFYLNHRNGGPMNKNKLAGLIYLANRRHMQKNHFPILDDDIIAMLHGPVNRLTYATVIGQHHAPKRFDELSDAEIDTLFETWREFGGMGRRTLLRFIRRICSEWPRQGDGRSPIPYECVFRAIGCAGPDTLANEIQIYRDMEKNF